jgi:transposase-like protein
MSVFSRAHFHDEEAAFAYVERELWPHGPVCPHCGCTGRVSIIKANPEKKVRAGLKFCGDCRKQFTVRVGTLFASSHLPMTKWLQAIHLMCASKKGVSAHQLHRVLECTYKTAWFLAHRIRAAMASGELDPFGRGGGAVEVDETFIGKSKNFKLGKKGNRPGISGMMKVLTLLDRDTGRARSMVIDDLKSTTIGPIVWNNLSHEARLMTDEAHRFKQIGIHFADHQTVNHAKDEYVRYASPLITTNTVESYFSVFKRGMRGTYQHCAEKHLHRYLAEFDFRYSAWSTLGVDDTQRASRALKGVVGKRLTYRRPDAGLTA